MPDQLEQKGRACTLPDREETLEAFVMGRLSETEEEKIAAHVFECEHCLRELEFQNNLKHAVNRMPAQVLAEVRPLPQFKGAIPTGRRAWLAAAAIVLLAVGLYSSMRLAAPQFYEQATLTRNDRDGLHVSSRSDSAQVEQEFAAAAQGLLAAEGKHFGLWPYFDQEKAGLAIRHLRAAYEKSNNAFARDEYAYFLGKAFLMQANSDSACAWLGRVLASPVRSYEREAESLKQALGCK